jgi:hypothetical protein
MMVLVFRKCLKIGYMKRKGDLKIAYRKRIGVSKVVMEEKAGFKTGYRKRIGTSKMVMENFLLEPFLEPKFVVVTIFETSIIFHWPVLRPPFLFL